MKTERDVKELLFNSITDPVPGLRRELDIIPIQENGQSGLYFHDQLGYMAPGFALDSSIGPLLSVLDGRQCINDIIPHTGNGISGEELLGYIRFLDEHRLLYSSYFKAYANDIEESYEAAPIHPSTTAGPSYPSDPAELTAYLDEAFAGSERADEPLPADVRALYAPHIDPRVGLDSYVQAFAPLRELTPNRVVILATSHYAGLYPSVYDNKPFIISKKDFELPSGIIPADKEAIDKLLVHKQAAGLSDSDRAHRVEHSIELHLLFLSYLWDHDFKIVPVLVKGFDDLYYMEESHLAGQIDALAALLNTEYGKDEDTLFLISGDLAHIGRKFGDDKPARELLREVKAFDALFMQHARQGDEASLLELIKRDYDPYRICGFPPLFTFLKAFSQLKGEILSYDIWDETERESAVTFGSILFSE